MPLPLSTGVGPTQGLITDGALFTKLIDEGGAKLAQLNGTQALNRSGLLMQGVHNNLAHSLRTDPLGNLSTSAWTLQFWEEWEGGTMHPQRWNIASATFNATQTQAQMLLNSAASVAANGYYLMYSTVYVSKQQRSPLMWRSRIRYQSSSNGAAVFGLSGQTTFTLTTAQQNGIYFQDTAGGALVPTVAFAATYLTGTPIATVPGRYYTYDIVVTDDDVQFTVLDTSTETVISEQTLRLPATQGRLQNESRFTPLLHVFHGATAPTTAAMIWCTDMAMGTIEQVLGRSAPTVGAAMGRTALYNPQTGATQFANNANSTAYATQTLSNTAPSMVGTSGVFQFVAPAGAITDYLMLVFTVPARSRFVCTGIDIQTVNTGAAVGTTPTTLSWFMVHNAPSFNTLVNGQPRKSLGMQSFPLGAAIGAQTSNVSRQFSTPLYIESGKCLQVAVRIPAGTATVGQVIMGTIDVEGYYE